MASIKRLPSGVWCAEVVTPIRLPSGKKQRISKTHRLKKTVEVWATAQEAAIAAGTWQNPRRGEITLGEYRELWRGGQARAGKDLAKVDSLWRTHLEPVWAGYPLQLITRPDLSAWVQALSTEQCRRCRATPATRVDDEGEGDLVLVDHTRLAKWDGTDRSNRRRLDPTGAAVEVPCSGSGQPAGLGAWTIQAVVSHLSGLLAAAVLEGRLAASPAVRLSLPTAVAKPVFFWSPEEARLVLLELGGPDALAVELMLYVGFRPGELYGLRRRFVDDRVWQVHVRGVATRSGWKAWAKTKRSNRTVPVPRHLRERLAEHLALLEPDDLVFPTAGGGTWDDREFAAQVFAPAVARAGVRVGTPYDCRHTAASWLVQRGVDLQRVQELLGHEKYSTTLRYAHLQPKAFDEVLDAWGDAPLDPRSAGPRETAEFRPSE